MRHELPVTTTFRTSFNRADNSCKAGGPVETLRDDVVVTTMSQEAAETGLSGEVRGATSARGLEVRNSFGNLIGWLDPGVKTEIRAVERRELSPLRGEV